MFPGTLRELSVQLCFHFGSGSLPGAHSGGGGVCCVLQKNPQKTNKNETAFFRNGHSVENLVKCVCPHTQEQKSLSKIVGFSILHIKPTTLLYLHSLL